ncbi:muts domain V-domain-containing protein [Vararia minispora EC-137]|uniref:Muts domain V-domain-containing protein n=1 Tax=Vararia minispora EC-137 TaxID=1314806 RepID=A0ACB8QJ51_9AGAM|nr:muts domain V-domain-containing protein [Vararia minispora EC-137]
MRQTVVSHFFKQKNKDISLGKRDSSPIDLTLSDEESRPVKKSKTAHAKQPLFLQLQTPEPPSPHAGTSRLPPPSPVSPASQRWCYDPSGTQTSPLRTRDQEQVRARFVRALLGDDTALNKSREPVQDESTDAGGSARLSEEESGTDDKFKQLQEMFAMSSKDKGKARGRRTTSAMEVRKLRKGDEVGPSGQTYTALEQQIRKLKVKYPGILLMVEVGYKCKFFGEDAKIAAKELGIVAYPDRNFTVAHVPVHRREIHMKKLLSQGHKVGIVEQTETAALKKASDTRNELFDRDVTHMYTAATYVDELESADDIQRDAPLLMCLVEQARGGMGADERVSIGMVVVCPSTGDVIWDEFEADGHMRIELETRMVHVKPAELLIPADAMTKPTERMLKYFVGHAATEHRIRVERYTESLTFNETFDFVSEFYTRKTTSPKASDSFTSGRLMAAVIDFPKQVIITLAQCIKYLSEFNIADALLVTKFFMRFTTRSHMLLNGNTLTNLEIYQNDTDYTKKGSLMWILDKTLTKFGSRLLHSWVGRPLVDIRLLRERTDAIEEIITNSSMHLVQLRGTLRQLPDLAKGLCRIQYGKCTPKELAMLLQAFEKVANAFAPEQNLFDIKSVIITDIIESLPRLREPVREIISAIRMKNAEHGDKVEMWTDPERYPEISDADMASQAVEHELLEELKSIRRVLKKPNLQWASVGGDEYLIEYSRAEDQSRIPAQWIIHSTTKKVRRYRTPVTREKLEERARYLEKRAKAADEAFASFLNEIAEVHYAVLRDSVNKLAIADCLCSLASAAVSGKYVKPEFVEGEADVLEIQEGRHPMIEALRSDPFVPNSIDLGGDSQRCKVITGPNMGGKSSTVRMVAIIAIMAQIGSYVPAKKVRLSMLDCVLTRMGASDELARGRSTFMVEMSETSDILLQASNNSLVILDELGRGTSTFDGACMSIAHAVLQHLVEVKRSKTLFITHYPAVAMELAHRFPKDVQNTHMSFAEDIRFDGTREIAFLYRLSDGLARDSFGVECARLAGLPEDVLALATTHAERMRELVDRRRRRNQYAHLSSRLLQTCSSPWAREIGHERRSQ